MIYMANALEQEWNNYFVQLPAVVGVRVQQ